MAFHPDYTPKFLKAQAATIEALNLEVGDTIKVLYIPKDYDNGWSLPISPPMRESVGREYQVIHIDTENGRGIRLNNTYWYPIQALQFISKGFKLSPDYPVIIQRNGSLHIDGKDIPYSVLKNIYEAAKKVIGK